jgi:FkbM family methyltransferase
MKPFEHAVIRIIQGALSLFGVRKRDRVLATISHELAPVLRVPLNEGEICIRCTSKKSLYWAKCFFAHEPDTIEWLDSLGQDSVFWDVGANIGIYSLYAASKGANVYAFEPMSENFACLQQNSFINVLPGSIKAFCVALSDHSGLCRLHLSEFSSGSDTHQFQSGVQTDNDDYTQTVPAISMDEFIQIFNSDPPTHLKIDVDGPEIDILHGAQQTLTDRRLRSVLIEGDAGNSERNEKIDDLLVKAGFRKTGQGSTAGGSIHCNYIYSRSETSPRAK